MTAFRALLGFILGLGITFSVYYVVLDQVFQPEPQSKQASAPAKHPPPHTGKAPAPKPAVKPAVKPATKSSVNITALIIASVCGILSAGYSAIAFQNRNYAIGFLSIVGYLLDITWSLLNTVAGFLVWGTASRIIGGSRQDSTDDSKRSGTIVFDKNPRGEGWVTTIGTVIAGKWSTHEETHVWQARIFGPAYMIVYIVTLLLNMLFRLCTGKTDSISTEAYYRICFEDWAYTAGTTSGSPDPINWGMWFLWFFLSLIYISLFALLAIGIAAKTLILLIVAIVGIVVYGLIRAFTPTNG